MRRGPARGLWRPCPRLPAGGRAHSPSGRALRRSAAASCPAATRQQRKRGRETALQRPRKRPEAQPLSTFRQPRAGRAGAHVVLRLLVGARRQQGAHAREAPVQGRPVQWGEPALRGRRRKAPHQKQAPGTNARRGGPPAHRRAGVGGGLGAEQLRHAVRVSVERGEQQRGPPSLQRWERGGVRRARASRPARADGVLRQADGFSNPGRRAGRGPHVGAGVLGGACPEQRRQALQVPLVRGPVEPREAPLPGWGGEPLAVSAHTHASWQPRWGGRGRVRRALASSAKSSASGKAKGRSPRSFCASPAFARACSSGPVAWTPREYARREVAHCAAESKLGTC